MKTSSAGCGMWSTAKSNRLDLAMNCNGDIQKVLHTGQWTRPNYSEFVNTTGTERSTLCVTEIPVMTHVNCTSKINVDKYFSEKGLSVLKII